MNKTSLIVFLTAIFLFILVLELVRRRSLRVEYSWLWLLTALIYLIIAIWPKLSDTISSWMGVTTPVIALSFIAFQFLVLILIQFSIHLTRLDNQVKNLTQLSALIDTDLKELIDRSHQNTTKTENENEETS